MNVLIIPEDFRKDQYMLKPIVKAMLEHLGKPRCRVEVLTDPLLGGIDQALNQGRLKSIVERYRGMVNVFLLCVDRDGDENRRHSLDAIEKAMNDLLPEGKRFLAENAWQEIEVWVLAGIDIPKEWQWNEIRQDPHPKEAYFLPIAQRRNLLAEPGEGRKSLALEAAKRYSQRIRMLCPEDIQALEGRIKLVGGI